MNIRTFILLAVLPIFVLLAAANAAVLYWTEEQELSTGLREQATAASISMAAYLGTSPHLAQRIAAPGMKAALQMAMSQVDGLDGIYVLDRGRRCCLLLIGRGPAGFEPFASRTGVPLLSRIRAYPDGERYVAARIRMADGAILGVHIDADRVIKARADLLWLALAMFAVGSAAGLWLALRIASWVTGDVQAVHELLADVSREDAPARGSLLFRETREAAEAITLMRRNIRTKNANFRSRFMARKTDRSPEALLAAYRKNRMHDLEVDLHGRRAAVRSIGTIDPGVFYAVVRNDTWAALLVGEVSEHDAVTRFGKALLLKEQLERCVDRQELSMVLEAIAADARIRCRALAWDMAGHIFLEDHLGGKEEAAHRPTSGGLRILTADPDQPDPAMQLMMDAFVWSRLSDALTMIANRWQKLDRLVAIVECP